MKALLVLLFLVASFVPAGKAVRPHEVVITARSVTSAQDIERAIQVATDYGSRPGIVTLDAKDGPFTYSEPDKSINIFHPNLTLRSLNAAVITNCDDGVFFDSGGTRNVVVRGITFRCTGAGVDAPTSPHERLVFEDNVIEAGGIGIALDITKDVLIRHNRIIADRAIHFGNSSRAIIAKNDLRGVIGVAFQGSNGNLLANNRISAQHQGVLLMSGANDNNIIANRIDGIQTAGIAFEGNNANNRVHGNCVACAAGFECLTVDANAPGVLEHNRISGNIACK